MPSAAAMVHFAGVLAILLLLSNSLVESQTDNLCDEVHNQIQSCLTFLQGSIVQPSSKCCDGLKELNEKAKTQQERTAICNCAKATLSHADAYNATKIPELPLACGLSSITLPPVDQSTNCDQFVNYYG